MAMAIGLGASALVLSVPSVGAAQGEPPPDDAIIDRFTAAFPDRDQLSAPRTTREELDRLTRLNPDRGDEVEAILRAYGQCLFPAAQSATLAMFREVARELGTARLNRLIRFYEGEDYRTFASIYIRHQAGEAISAADNAILARIVTDYPLMDFYQIFEPATRRMRESETYRPVLVRCSNELAAELAAQGLRIR
ncbi:MAG: hypothetical protein ACT4N8_08940 [Sphingosinicella sp.]|uniref:hypothetical protein n=1 Tax=Sphingosinicella sp. TaxID=1917971 RepID=UPI0040383CB8